MSLVSLKMGRDLLFDIGCFFLDIYVCAFAFFFFFSCPDIPVVLLNFYKSQIVQSIVSLTSLLVVKLLTVLVSTISNSQVFLPTKCE